MLDDINDYYPQTHTTPIQSCDNDRCDTELYDGDEVIEHGGYHYCCGGCLVNQVLREGNALKITIGR